MGDYFLCYLMLLALGSLTLAQNEKQVIFIPKGEVVTGKAVWSLTFMTDLSQTNYFLEKNEEDLMALKRTINTVRNRFGGEGHEKFKSIIDSVYWDVMRLKDRLENKRSQFTSKMELLSIHKGLGGNRSKKSLLPLGNLFKFLFGVASESEIMAIANTVEAITQNQEKIIHNLKESLTIVNITRMEVEENRNEINELIHAVTNINLKIDNTSEELFNVVKPLNEFVMAYAQILSSVHDMSDYSNQVLEHLDRVDDKLDMLSLKHLSPNVIHPTIMLEALLHIEENLPDQLRLPESPKESLWFYYSSTTCYSIFHDLKIMTTCKLPLVDRNEVFELYEAMDLPIPMGNSSLAMTYYLEFSKFAVSKDRTRFMILKDEDYHLCLQHSPKSCSINLASYPLESSFRPSCVMSIYLQDQKLVNQLCKIHVLSGVTFPIARPLDGIRWAISLKEPLELVIICLNGKRDIYIAKPPLSIVNLRLGCKAISPHLELPVQARYHSNHIITEVNLLPIIQPVNLTGSKLLSDLEAYPHVAYHVKMPEDLKDVYHMPLSTFAANLSPIKHIKTPLSWMETVPLVLLILIILVLIIGPLSYKCYGCQVCRRCIDAKKWRSVPVGDDEAGPPEQGGQAEDAIELSVGQPVPVIRLT